MSQNSVKVIKNLINNAETCLISLSVPLFHTTGGQHDEEEEYKIANY